MSDLCAIHWFRNDLRLMDNPSLLNAASHKNVLPIYIIDNTNVSNDKLGDASKWWLHHSLQSLNNSLDGKLSLYIGDPLIILIDLIKRFNVSAVYWNRLYEGHYIQRDAKIKEYLKSNNVISKSTNSYLLWEPWTIKKNDNEPYKVFTAFYRKGCLSSTAPRCPLPKPQNINYIYDSNVSLSLDQCNLLPRNKWYKKLESYWTVGESGAHQALEKFCNAGLHSYKGGRDIIDKDCVSKLSASLHFGEISPHYIWHRVKSFGENKHIDTFCSQLAWREFSYVQLYYNPNISRQNLQSKFNQFPWNDNQDLLHAWKFGNTGIPMVDAGMRSLYETGYMHNRLRMIVASFLVKNLLIHWHHGAQWFLDTLVDADIASNSSSWQWVAGCGLDAAPYFRIFNPIIQGHKFDPDGNYIRRFVPEVSALPNKYLFSPWEAPKDLLESLNIQLGITYPLPIVDLMSSRQQALEYYKNLK